MKKFICFLIIISCRVNAVGTHLISLRESEEADFRVMSKSVHFKGDEQLRYSVLLAQEMLKRLHSSEEHQVVAAWSQIVWLQNDEALFGRMKTTDRWGLRGERVKKLLGLLAKASQAEKSISELYERCYNKTEFKDRYVPGCGNRPMALLRPEKFAQKMLPYVAESRS